MKELYVFFSANYFPHVGGVERYTYSLTRELLKCGKHVVIITSSMKDEPNYFVDDDGAEIYRMPAIYALGGRMPVPLPGKAWRTVKNVIRRYDQVKVVIQTMLYPISLWALNFAHKSKYPYIVISHGSNYVCQGHGLLDWAEHKYEELMLRQAKKKYAVFFSVSKSAGKWLGKFQIFPCGVLYNSVNYSEIDDICKEMSGSFRNELGIQKNTVVFSFVGRLIAEKGVFQLVDAFSKLISEGWDIRLFIVGDGPEMKALSANHQNKIVYFGYKSHQETILILKESDCFCLPSDSEGMPTVVLEAILCGNYIVISPYGGAVEIITSDKYGHVMDGNSRDDVYRALKYFLEHREVCNDAVALCRRQFFEGGFTWENTCKRMVAYFDENQRNRRAK